MLPKFARPDPASVKEFASRFSKCLLVEIGAFVHSQQLLTAPLLLVFGWGIQYFTGNLPLNKVAELLTAGLFPFVLVLCLCGTYLIVKAAKSVWRDLKLEAREYKPLVAVYHPKPPPVSYPITAASCCILIFTLVSWMSFHFAFPRSASTKKAENDGAKQPHLTTTSAPQETPKVISKNPKGELGSRSTSTSDSMKFEIAPFILIERINIDADKADRAIFLEGIGLILKVVHHGSDVHYVRSVRVSGDINITGNDYIDAAMENGITNVIEIGDIVRSRVPYRTISWTALPSANAKVDVGDDEEFMVFVISRPRETGRITSDHEGNKPKAHEYFGYHDTEETPRLLTTAPYQYDLFDRVNTNKQGMGTAFTLRKEVFTGKVHFAVNWDSGTTIIPVADLKPTQWTWLQDWKEHSPRDLFYQQELQNRPLPVPNPLAK